MAKNKKYFNDFLKVMNNEIFETRTVTIPDIITFCESPQWLGLSSSKTNPMQLFAMQRIMLKAFYRGSIGNENLKLTEEELRLCENYGLNSADKGDVLGKYHNNELFKELVLVWGRRSGKDFVSSIIALYEAMKLLECEGGDPYAYYEIAYSADINILTVANSAKQSKVAFDEIKDKFMSSPYFSDKYIKEGIETNAIHLLTKKDKEDNEKYKREGLPIKKGSIGILVGHSNSDSLLGKGCIVVILDEVASYKNTGGSGSGDRIYAALTPTLSTYCRRIYQKDESDNFIYDEFGQKIIQDRRYDGKIISISSPRSKEGKFYELFSTAQIVRNRLVCRLPTWEVNPTHTRESLRNSNNTMSETEFNMEFGSEFSGVGAENFLSEDQVESCFRNHSFTKLRDYGEPGKLYFAHIDPATSSHNYSLVIIHKEYFLNQITKKSDYIIVVDHIKYWTPSDNRPIDVDEVDEYIKKIKRNFFIVSLTYDQWNRKESIDKLKKEGIPNKKTQFTYSFKNIIYKELENLINSNRIKIPYEYLLKREMLELQRKFDNKGFKVFPKKDGEGVKSDDVIDSLAGACYAALEHMSSRLPHTVTVEFSQGSGANDITWRSMQGTSYGTGPGGQVANKMDKYKRYTRY